MITSKFPMKYLWICVLWLAALPVSGQQAYWVFLKDKGPGAAQRLSQPETFLSADALAIRREKGVAVDLDDVPVSPAYLQSLRSCGFEVIGASRWLNAAVVRTDAPESLRQLAFVAGFRPAARMQSAASRETQVYDEVPAAPVPGAAPFDYGRASFQNQMLKIQALHERGITGRGVRVAVFDAGFLATDTIEAFDSLWINEQIIATRDFVDGDDQVYDTGSHGTQVLSTIAANIPGKMVGMAPHATFVLARTEDTGSETQVEEYNWLRAMEWADSIGVDLIHSSLGYNNFDDDVNSYTYEDMDGNTAVSSRAADLAASRGILVTVSAGNEGYSDWHYISAPSDADSVLCVGAVDRTLARADFSSFGPSSDGQVKPDVVALGARTTVANPNNRIGTSDGTSFSGPIVAGFAICLLQAHPERSNMEIIQAIRLSADQYTQPDDEYGYGIPDAVKADSLLANVKDLSTVKMEQQEKPLRGIEPAPDADATVVRAEREPIVYTANPQTRVQVSGGKLTITTGAEYISSFGLYRQYQKLTFNPVLVQVQDSRIEVDTRYMLKGEHYVHIVTSSYEEYVPFTIE